MYRVEGDRHDGFGASMATLDDLNGDGVRDLLVGAPWSDGNADPEVGAVEIRSGADGALIRRASGHRAGEEFGTTVAVLDDLDGDGVREYLVGAPLAPAGWQRKAGSVSLYSGGTGAVLARLEGGDQWQFGSSVAGAGDLDGDGVRDFLVAAPFHETSPGRVGTVQAYSGRTYEQLWVSVPPLNRPGVGNAHRCIAAVADQDGDGTVDVLVGKAVSFFGTAYSGGLAVLSGRTGTVLREQWPPLWPVSGLGVAVSAASDLDGDGTNDYLISDPHAFGSIWQVGPGGVFALSGRTGRTLWEAEGLNSGERFGSSLAPAGDLDGDGVDDILVGISHAMGGAGISGGHGVVSGATGALISRKTAGLYSFQGWSIAELDDLDGDGLPEWVVGSPAGYFGTSTYGRGAVEVHRLDPFLVIGDEEFSLSAGQPTKIVLSFPLSEADQRYALLASLHGTGPSTVAGIELPLSRDRLLNWMSSAWQPPNLRGNRGRLAADGTATAHLLPQPAMSPLLGRRITWAAMTFDRRAWGLVGRLSSAARSVVVVP